MYMYDNFVNSILQIRSLIGHIQLTCIGQSKVFKLGDHFSMQIILPLYKIVISESKKMQTQKIHSHISYVITKFKSITDVKVIQIIIFLKLYYVIYRL